MDTVRQPKCYTYLPVLIIHNSFIDNCIYSCKRIPCMRIKQISINQSTSNILYLKVPIVCIMEEDVYRNIMKENFDRQTDVMLFRNSQ